MNFIYVFAVLLAAPTSTGAFRYPDTVKAPTAPAAATLSEVLEAPVPRKRVLIDYALIQQTVATQSIGAAISTICVLILLGVGFIIFLDSRAKQKPVWGLSAPPQSLSEPPQSFNAPWAPPAQILLQQPQQDPRLSTPSLPPPSELP